MKKGINQWAFPTEMSVEDCIRLAAAAGFEGIELNFTEKGEFSLESSVKQVNKIKRLAEKSGIELPSVCMELPYMLTSDDVSEREKAENGIKRSLKIARDIGADTLLVVPGGVDFSMWIGPHKIVPYEVVYQRAQKGIINVGKEAKKTGVIIGIENVWNKFLLSPLEFRRFLDEINHEYVKAYFDVANVLIYGYPEQWIRILGKRITKIHIKDFKVAIGNISGFTNLLEGDVNWPEVMKALGEIKYNGYLIAEVMPPYKFHPERLIYETSNSMNELLKTIK